MAPPTYAELIRADTETEIRDLLLGFFGVVGFQVTAWGEFSFPLRAVNGIARFGGDLAVRFVEIGKGGYGDTARGGWAKLWAYDRFEVEGNPARTTTGKMVLVDAGGGPHVVVAGGLIVGMDPDDGRTFVSTEDVTVPLNGSATVAVEASATGYRFNIPTGARLRLVTDLPTVTVTNPAQADSDTWITTAGADEETPEALVKRARLQWAELSIATPAKFYASKIKKAIPTVTGVRVLDDNPMGPGTLRCVLATGAGPASGSDVTLANSLLRLIRSGGAGATDAVAATAREVRVGGTCYVAAAQLVAARSAVITLLAAEQARLATMEDDSTVYAAEIIRIVKSQPGVRNFVPEDGLTDTTAADEEVLTLTHAIRYVAE